MKKYYVSATGQFRIVSRHEFKSDKQAMKWFIGAYEKDNGVALYRSVSTVMNIYKDRRLA